MKISYHHYFNKGLFPLGITFNRGFFKRNMMLLQQSNHVRNFCDGFYLTEKPAAHFYTWRKKTLHRIWARFLVQYSSLLAAANFDGTQNEVLKVLYHYYMCPNSLALNTLHPIHQLNSTLNMQAHTVIKRRRLKLLMKTLFPHHQLPLLQKFTIEQRLSTFHKVYLSSWYK